MELLDPSLSTTGEADFGGSHQECMNGTVSALQCLKWKIYKVNVKME